MERPPRLVVVHPYWGFWAHSTAFDLEASRDELLDRAVTELGNHGEVVWSGIFDDARLAPTIAELDERDFDVLVIAQSMATPPAATLALLDAIGSKPVLIWALRATRHVGVDFDHSAVTSHGATVGSPMLTSVLVRSGRPFELIASSLEDADLDPALRLALGAAAASGRISRARIGRVGRPIDGYVSVDLDPERLRAATGTTIVDIESQEFVDSFHAVDEDDVAAARSAVLRSHAVDSTVVDDELNRAVRCKIAVDALVKRHRLDAGAFNCHVPGIRLGADIGVAPCFALGCSTSEGVPWTCAGDVVTAAAMLIVKALGAPALYHELEAFDSNTGVFAVANTGETDLGLLAAGQTPSLAANPWFDGDRRSLCSRFTVAAGPATLVGFAQLDRKPGHRLIVAPGRFTDGGFPATGTTNAGFEFARSDAVEAWRQWCLAGANHHGVLAAGDLAAALELLGRHLDVEVVRI